MLYSGTSSMRYFVETYGCQMNVSDSQRLASELERLGHRAVHNPNDADILVVNTCVVRQSAEATTSNRLMTFKHLKEQYPDKMIGAMGCLVGGQDELKLRQRVPYVDVFMQPSNPKPIVDFLYSPMTEVEVLEVEAN